MRLLLDSHAVIWWVDQDQLLSPAARTAISDPSNDLLVSAGTIWEIAIKTGLGKLALSMPYLHWMSQVIANIRAVVLPITVGYADVQAGLPKHHGDPFDHLLSAQALVENVPVVSADPVFDQYGVTRVWW